MRKIMFNEYKMASSKKTKMTYYNFHCYYPLMPIIAIILYIVAIILIMKKNCSKEVTKVTDEMIEKRNKMVNSAFMLLFFILFVIVVLNILVYMKYGVQEFLKFNSRMLHMLPYVLLFWSLSIVKALSY